MMRTCGLLVLVMIGSCISPVMHFGDGKTAKQAQHDTMNEMGPARLVTGEKWNGQVTTRKVRVWADDQFRAQNRHWQQAFEEPLELANLVVTPVFGIHIVAEYSTWDHNVPDGTLGDHMRALQEQDPGDDVLAVIGLTSSLSLVSATFDELGLAMVGGRHIVLRGYADLEERKMYADAFPDLRAEEREMALVQLRRHKTAVVLLHELGHVLGVEHEIDSDSIMNASYSNHAKTFSPAARATMTATLDQRLHRTSATVVAASASAPQAQAQPVAPKVHHPPIVIRVTRNRSTIVDGKTLKPDALDALLKAAFAEDPETRIVVNEDRNVPTGAVGDLLDRAKAIGFTKVEFGWSGK